MRRVFVLLFVAATVIVGLNATCRKKEEPQKEEAAPEKPKVRVEPRVMVIHESVSSGLTFETLTYPGIEECDQQYPLQLLFIKYGSPPVGHPCGFRIVDTKTRETLHEFAWVENRLANTIMSKADDCDVNELEVLHGFKRLASDGSIVYSVNSLWYGSADPSSETSIYDWRRCKKSFFYAFEHPHCPGLCNSVLYYRLRAKEYLFYRTPDTNVVTIFGRRKHTAEPHDFYLESGGSLESGDTPVDPSKVKALGGFESTDYPAIENDEEGNLIIRTPSKTYKFDVVTETLQEQG